MIHIRISNPAGLPHRNQVCYGTGITSLFLLMMIMFLLMVPPHASAARITDMTGRTAAIPDRIEKVFAVSPPGTYLVYAIDPSAVIGLNFPLKEHEKRYTVESFHTLPVIGGMVGQGRNVNKEVLLLCAPDVIVIWTTPDISVNTYYENIFRELNLPWINIRLDTLEDYPEALLFMGQLLGKKDRARQLHDYSARTSQQIQATVNDIPAEKRPRIYYAEGMDGLSTERSTSMHVQLIEFCGGINIHSGKVLNEYTMEKISLEQVIIYNPDIVLIKEQTFYNRIYSDPRWQRIKAVQDRKCYLIPHVPFNWFDRPPSFMRIIGAKWLLSILHPDRLSIDMIRETTEFYRLFLGVELSGDDAAEVLGL